MGPPQGRARSRHTDARVQGMDAAGTIDAVEWSSPTVMRARLRPSNLQSQLRGSSTFALTKQRLSRSNSRGELQSPGPSVRGQATRSTQTTHPEPMAQVTAHSNADTANPLCLGAFGPVEHMTVETLDFLIRVLTDRKQEVLRMEQGNSPAHSLSRTGPATHLESRQPHTSCSVRQRPQPDDQTESAASTSTHHDQSGLVRSRSYEALVQMERILEERHRRLMSDGVLGTEVDDSSSYDLHAEIRKLQNTLTTRAQHS
ncbi:hypothetical protein PINS_up002365 [Pythium insidiosum]|nr:hypothetical protein PINS_up002365 [Pythium insidiosum]